MYTDKLIIAECPRFACRECHTKTGHPHQHWCSQAADDTADRTGCAECLYWQESRGKCTHPYVKKGGDNL